MTRGPLPLRDAFASPETKRRYVRELFATIADRYDLITVLLSFGLDRRWKRRVITLSTAAPGRRTLDLACGTGDLAFAAAAAGSVVTGLDVTHRMVQLARGKGQAQGAGAGRAVFVQGDMMALPFGDAEFDVVTTGYGLRNVADLAAAIREIRRVLRPGGVLVSLDFNRPRNAAVRAIYLGYLTLVGGALGWVLHRNPDTYRYIPASIRRYPGARGVVDMLLAGGFSSAEWKRTLGGLMAIHVARR